MLKIKKLHKDAKIPTYAHDTDSGMDLYSIEDCTIFSGGSCLIHTGMAIQLPHNTEAQIRSRSGLALNNGIVVLNSPGTVDEGYRGEIGVILINHSNQVLKVSKGMKIAQMVIAKVEKPGIMEVEELDDSDRGSGGFGSTGV